MSYVFLKSTTLISKLPTRGYNQIYNKDYPENVGTAMYIHEDTQFSEININRNIDLLSLK